jgi:hypothetical protein
MIAIHQQTEVEASGTGLGAIRARGLDRRRRILGWPPATAESPQPQPGGIESILALNTVLGCGLALGRRHRRCAKLRLSLLQTCVCGVIARREYLIKLQTPRLAFLRLLVFPYRARPKTLFLLRRLRPSVGLQGPEQENRSAQCGGLELSSQVC